MSKRSCQDKDNANTANNTNNANNLNLRIQFISSLCFIFILFYCCCPWSKQDILCLEAVFSLSFICVILFSIILDSIGKEHRSGKLINTAYSTGKKDRLIAAIMRPFRPPLHRNPIIPGHTLRVRPRRHFSTPKTDTATSTTTTYSRLRRFNGRLPAFLRPYTTPLLSAPITHVTSFLILHEITAVVPLFALVGTFHYGGWLPTSFVNREGPTDDGEEQTVFDQGVARFGKWLRKKGWVDSEDVGNAVAEGERGGGSEGGVRLILEFATAYAITKALLPVRLIGSVWATPWFARVVVVPVGRSVRRLFRWGKNGNIGK